MALNREPKPTREELEIMLNGIQLDGQYGDKSPFAGKYAKEFSASITGGGKATRFRSESSYGANKIYIDEEKKYVVFLSPTYGGVNIFSDWIPYKNRQNSR